MGALPASNTRPLPEDVAYEHADVAASQDVRPRTAASNGTATSSTDRSGLTFNHLSPSQAFTGTGSKSRAGLLSGGVQPKARRPIDPDDSNEAGLQMPTLENGLAKLLALAVLLSLLAYIGIRLADIVDVHKVDRHGWRTVYRHAFAQVASVCCQQLLM